MRRVGVANGTFPQASDSEADSHGGVVVEQAGVLDVTPEHGQ
jgi:hypothetical protein